MNRHSIPPPRIDCGSKGQVGQSENGASMDKTETVQMVIANFQFGPCSAFTCRDQFNANKSGKQILSEKVLYRF